MVILKLIGLKKKGTPAFKMLFNKKKTLALSENHALPIELTSPTAATQWLKIKFLNLSAGPDFKCYLLW